MGVHERFANARNEVGGVREGLDIERAVLGAPSLPQNTTQPGYITFNAALDLVRKHQPNQLNRTPLATKLRGLVAERSNDSSIPVKFYTAVGTPLDHYHGIDAFFEQGNARVTVDVSAREKDIFKADILLHATLDRDGRVVITDEEMSRAAENIAGILNLRARRTA